MSSWHFVAALSFSVLASGCSGAGPCNFPFDGTYSATVTTVTPAGTTNRSDSFTVSAGAVSDAAGTFTGAVSASGAFTGTTIVCQSCQAMAVTGQFSADSDFTLAGSSGSVSQSIVARRTKVSCATGGTGGGSQGGGGGGSATGGGTSTGGGSATGGGGGAGGGCGAATGGGTASGGGTATGGGGGGGASDGGGIEVVAQGTQPFDVAVDDTFVYWTEAGGRVVKADKSSLVITELAIGRYGGPYRLALDATTVYWTELAIPGVFKVPKNGSGAFWISTAAGGIAVGGGWLYWCAYNANTVAGLGLTDGDGGTQLIATNQNTPWNVAADDGRVYWTNTTNGRVSSAPRGGGPVTDLFLNATEPYALEVDATDLYFTELGGSTAGSGRVRRLPLDGGAATILASGLHAPYVLALDGLSVYWGEAGGHAVKKVSLRNGDVTTLMTGTEPVYGVAVDATHVYWTEQASGLVKRMPK